MNYDLINTTFRKLAIAGAAEIMDVYGQDDFGVRSKDDASPVTEADERADKVISDGLREIFPDIALVTEEQSDSHTVDATTFIIVDPLDGTKEFINRRGDFTFCLVATGEADLYPRVGRTMEWDTAAGHAVLSGAGGQVVRFDDHTPLKYGKADYANPFFIAYAPGVDLKPA